MKALTKMDLLKMMVMMVYFKSYLRVFYMLNALILCLDLRSEKSEKLQNEKKNEKRSVPRPSKTWMSRLIRKNSRNAHSYFLSG